MEDFLELGERVFGQVQVDEVGVVVQALDLLYFVVGQVQVREQGQLL